MSEDHTKAVKAVSMAINALETIKYNLEQRTITGTTRAKGYLDSAKNWLTQADQELSTDDAFANKLSNALNKTTIDAHMTEVEYVQPKRVIIINGAFDVERLRKYLNVV